MKEKEARRWSSWEDYRLEWCQRDDFRAMLPQLQRGEDEQFVSYLERLIHESAASAK